MNKGKPQVIPAVKGHTMEVVAWQVLSSEGKVLEEGTSEPQEIKGDNQTQ